MHRSHAQKGGKSKVKEALPHSLKMRNRSLKRIDIELVGLKFRVRCPSGRELSMDVNTESR